MLSHIKDIKYLFNCGILFVFLIVVCSGCRTISPAKRPITSIKNHRQATIRALGEKDRLRLAFIASKAVGQSRIKVNGKSFRSDCSGTIRAIFRKARIGLGGVIKNNSENDVKAIYRYVQKYGKILKKDPKLGDLVFFHNTYDRSRNGRMNDALTHIGIVEKVEGSIVHFIHHLGESIIRSRMDLSHPHDTFLPERNIRANHILRRAQGPNRAYTAAELFAGFGRL